MSKRNGQVHRSAWDTLRFPFCIAHRAIDLASEVALASFRREDPRAVLPGGMMTHVATVPTRQHSDPVTRLILVEFGDLASHHSSSHPLLERMHLFPGRLG